MPKRQAQRIIDSRRRNSSTTIIGATGSGTTVTLSAGDGLTLTGTTLAVDSTVVRTTRTVTAGSGLTGGGALSADLTLNVGAGTLITVGADTVGIASGSNYQFIGTGSGTAAAWRNVSELAGNGLTASNGVLAVGAGDGLTVSADAIALTTPGTLTISTTNNSTSNHTHAIATSSNPGVAASILASDASGYLQLVRLGLGMAPTKPLSVSGDAGISGNVATGSLSVSGAATVGGDFTVGANVLYVNQAGTRVGINRAPDQQFDLDVAGAIRGQYLVGRHAIQLASAVGVWHFDGPAPYNLDFTGSNASHAGVGGTETGGVIYRPGRYGKAVQVAEVTTNLCTNPSFETNTTGWGTDYPATTTLERVADGWVGAYFLRVTATGTGNFYSPAVSVTNSTAYAASFWYRTTATVKVQVTEYGNNIVFGWATLPTATEWTRYTILMTTPASGSSVIRIVFTELGAGESIDIDAVQIEQKAYATSYCDGSLGAGHSWSGTAHASTSSRTGATLTYANNAGLNGDEGTIMLWAKHEGMDTSGMGLFGTGANAQFDAYVHTNGSLVFRQNSIALSYAAGITASVWNHYCFTWSKSANVRKIFLNGVEVASRQFDAGATLDSTLYVGSITAGSNYSVNGLVDEFVILDYAADPKLIRAIYESDAPVFVESSVFHWRSPSRVPIWVDEFGLWARSVSGNEILGLYGGDPRNPTGGVTKSWGGVTMSENDIVIGRASGGYLFWDDSAQTLTVQGTITATAGSIGGWTVDTTKLAKDTGSASTSSGLAPSDYPFYAGATYANRSSAPFRVTPAGALTATSGTIGGWTIGATTLSGGNATLNSAGSLTLGTSNDVLTASAADATYRLWIGNATAASAPFRVTKTGALTATNATITGAITASSGSITGVLSIGTSGEIRQGTGTLGSDFTGLRIMQSSSIGQVAVYDANVKTLRISSDDVRYRMATDFNSIRTIKWLENIDYAGTWSDLSSAHGNYAYIGAYYTSTNSYLYLSNRVNSTSTPANTRYSQISLIASRNESGTVYSKGLQLVTLNSTYNYDGIAFLTSMALQLSSIATPSYGLSASSDAQFYLKNGYVVFRYNDGGTYRYKYLNLAGTGTSWTHSTTAP